MMSLMFNLNTPQFLASSDRLKNFNHFDNDEFFYMLEQEIYDLNEALKSKLKSTELERNKAFELLTELVKETYSGNILLIIEFVDKE